MARTPAYRARNFLIRAALLRDKVPSFDDYPFNIPAIGNFTELDFEQPVTFFIGENGSGKSTLLEAIAVASGLNPEGGSRNFNFSTRASHSGLKDYLRLTRGALRARDSYFLRAESYFNVATNIEELDREPACAPPIIDSYGGKSLHEQSHGESFFALLMNRLGGDGLYIFDEPEAALSPTRQLAFLSRLHELVGRGSQFLIATHSPILMAYPQATIYLLADGAPSLIPYGETEHYRVTRQFLTRTAQMLDILLNETGETEPDDG
ncbi:MAG TPA: AAA family ATPase [Stellaceae bacterium]|nr:AAA family ATPase [Stellaceae bacterium]